MRQNTNPPLPPAEFSVPQSPRASHCVTDFFGLVKSRKTARARWTLPVILCLLFQSFAALALAQEYVLHRIPLEPSAMINGMNDFGLVVGFHASPDGKAVSPRTGFIYDHLGIIDQSPGSVYSLDELIPTPSGFNGSSCIGINNHCQVVGSFSDSNGGRIGYFLDLLTGTWGLLPAPSWSAYSYGMRINDSGDVLVVHQDAGSWATKFEADVYNISLGSPALVRSLGEVRYLQDMNNLGQVTGELLDGTRVIIGADGSLTSLPFVNAGKLNNLGVVAGTYTVPGPKNRVEYRAGRFFGGVLEPIANFSTQVRDFNDHGDVASTEAVFTDETGWTFINNAVVGYETGASDEMQFWSNSSKGITSMSNRISAQAWLAGSASRTTTTGKGKTAVTTTETRFYLLTPPSTAN